MSELTDPAFYGLAQGQTVAAKLTASNSAGTSDFSLFEADAVLAETVPTAVLNVRRGALTTQTQLEIEYDALTSESGRGGNTATILSYKIEWDQGSGTDSTWAVLAGVQSHYTAL